MWRQHDKDNFLSFIRKNSVMEKTGWIDYTPLNGTPYFAHIFHELRPVFLVGGFSRHKCICVYYCHFGFRKKHAKQVNMRVIADPVKTIQDINRRWSMGKYTSICHACSTTKIWGTCNILQALGMKPFVLPPSNPHYWHVQQLRPHTCSHIVS